MIERHVYVRLHPQFVAERATMAAYAQKILAAVPGVIAVTAGVPADEHSEAAWDLFIALRFASVADVEAYRVHPEHQRYLDAHLTPRTAVKKAWNFELTAE